MTEDIFLAQHPATGEPGLFIDLSRVGLKEVWVHADCPFKVGDRIIEKQHNSDPRTVEEIVEGKYIVCKGFVRSRISWRNLYRYRLAA